MRGDRAQDQGDDDAPRGETGLVDWTGVGGGGHGCAGAL